MENLGKKKLGKEERMGVVLKDYVKSSVVLSAKSKIRDVQNDGQNHVVPRNFTAVIVIQLHLQE